MRTLSLVILPFLLLFFTIKQDTPHGNDFKVSCNLCHSAKGWELDKEIYSFNHNNTKLALVGQHIKIDCRQCHQTLIFNEAKTQCSECHKDLHQSTVGFDCSRCHTPASWLVNNINEIHQMSRFPLLGAHRTADCSRCHKSESLVRFDVSGANCVDCHRKDYISASSPNHVQSGFSEECSSCHPLNSFQWEGSGFSHAVFPLTQGHSAINCAQCHSTGNYTDASPDCYSCHQVGYNSTVNPNHKTLSFSTTCTQCHTTSPDWKPASYTQHDNQSFPIFSGKHRGKWDICTECHTNTANYALYTCITCHHKSEMDGKHKESNGYSYDSIECFRCHPKGNS